MSLSSNTPALNALQLYHFRHNGTISVLPQLFLFLLPTKGHKQTWPPLFPGLQDFLVFWLWLFLWPPHFLASLENKWFCSVTLVSVKFISNMHYSLSKGKCALNFSITLDVLQEYNIHMVQNSVFKTGFHRHEMITFKWQFR